MTTSDELLLAAIGGGDECAFAQFFDRHGAQAHGLARSILLDSVAAEDAVQDAFLRVWRFASGFDPRRGNPRAWLLTIVRNTSLDVARLRGSVTLLDPEVLIALALPDTADEPADAAIASSEVLRVRQALRELPPEQQRALLLARWYGWSAAEIATADGLPLGTVKSRIRLALDRLRISLAECGSPS